MTYYTSDHPARTDPQGRASAAQARWRHKGGRVMSKPASELTRDDVNHWVTLHDAAGDTEAVLLAVHHERAYTSLRVSMLLPDAWGGTRHVHASPRDEPGSPLVVTVGRRYVNPGEKSTAKPERSKDWADTVNSPRD